MVDKPIDTKKLDSDLTLLTGIGRFSSASYNMTEIDGQTGLMVNVRERNNAPPVLQIAFSIDGTEPDNVTYTLGGRLTFLDVGGFGSEWRTSFAIGNTYGIASEYYKRFTQASKWFYAPQVTISNSGQWIYSYNDPKADYRIIRAGAGVDIGYAIDRFSEVRAGYEIGYLNADLKLGTPTFSSVKGQVGATRFRYINDHLDEPIVPTAGYFGRADFHLYDTSPGASSAFPNLEMTAEYFKRVFRRFRLRDRSGRNYHGIRADRHSSVLPRRSKWVACVWHKRAARRSVLLLSIGLHAPFDIPAPVRGWWCLRHGNL